MARSNKAARQRNTKGRLNRREKGASRIPANRSIQRLDVSDMIIPDGTCLRNPQRPKAMFRTEENAKIALEQAQRMRARMGSGHVEKRYYACPEDRGCGGYHLTSRESYEDAWTRTRPSNVLETE